MSTETTLHVAVLAVQAELPALQRDKINPHFKSKYLSLEKLLEQVIPVINRHGLIWLTMPDGLDGEPALRYELLHAESGDSITGIMPLLVAKKDPQGLGSAITYARRYSLQAVLGISADEDDDGNAASRSNGRQVSSAPAQQTVKAATAKQRGLINGKAAEQGLSSTDLANIVLAATESEPKDFTDDEHASNWLKRAMDRLPAKHVDAVLAGIAGA